MVADLSWSGSSAVSDKATFHLIRVSLIARNASVVNLLRLVLEFLWLGRSEVGWKAFLGVVSVVCRMLIQDRSSWLFHSDDFFHVIDL